MRVLQVATECAPWAKAGGLGDVVFGLSRAMSRMGHQVAIVLPYYERLFEQLRPRKLCSFGCQLDGRVIPLEASIAQADGVELILIGEEAPLGQSHGVYLRRHRIYGDHDDPLRMGFFCKAVLELMRCQSWQVDVIHAHDWATSLLPVLAREHLTQPRLVRSGICLTLHNLESQGLCDPEVLRALGLDVGKLMTPEGLQDLHRPGQANLLQGGISYADRLTTVSPSYAQEILVSPGGRGLETLLRKNAWKLSGILNGLDFDYWNPETDPLIPTHFSAGSGQLLERKREMKHQLQRRCHLEINDRPMFVTVSRLTPQKGLDLIERAIFEVLRQGGQFVLQGSSPAPSIQAHFQALKLKWSSCRSVHFHLQPDENLTHWIFAGADAVVVPSLFEPCGLTQMIGMRYGAVPIVRETGGLRDTVFDAEYSSEPPEIRNGFSFKDPDQAAIDWVIRRVFDWWAGRPREFHTLRLHGMRADNSWAGPALHYQQVYDSMAAEERAESAGEPAVASASNPSGSLPTSSAIASFLSPQTT
jgi:starch synthase